MNEHSELERLLRGALDDEARRYEPAGDGLTTIRARVGRRRWLRSPFGFAAGALVTAAAAVTAFVVVPAVVDRGHTPAITAPPASPGPVPTSPTGVPTASPTGGNIGGDPALPDYAAIWPYASRRIGNQQADADISTGKYPHLASAEQTAADFVAAFIGGGQQLSAKAFRPYGPGVLIVVSRAVTDGASVPITTVQLIRVRKGDDAPYVVVGASQASLGDRLKLLPLPKLTGTAQVTVTGTETRPGDAAAVHASLREPGGRQDLGLGAVQLPRTGANPATWSIALSPFRPLTSSGALAAWTTDATGEVTEFVAAPILTS